MNWRRLTGFVLLAAGLGGALTWGLMPRPVRVDARPAVVEPMTVTVEEEGQTRLIDRYVVSAPVDGYARRVDLDVGAAVERGQVLVKLEPMRSEVLDPRRRAEAEARVAAAGFGMQAARETARAAKAEAEIATAEYRRRRDLRDKGSVSQEAVDQAEARMRQATAERRSADFNVQVARYEQEAAQTALQYSAAQQGDAPPESVSVDAPISGRVLRVAHESEGVVKGGEALIEIGDPAALEVAVDVLSADAVQIHPGTRVYFDRWGGDLRLEGLVRTVEPVGFTKISALGVEEQRVWVIADITSPRDAWARLGDGYRVEASFVIWEGQSVLQVPNSSLFRLGDGWGVFVIADGRAQTRKLAIGRRNGLMAEVLDGLASGEVVIAHPSDAVQDGVRVVPRE